MRAHYLLALSLFLAGCTASSRPEPALVGHLAPLSGQRGVQGEQTLAGIALAVQQAREANVTVEGRHIGVLHVDSARGTARAEAVRLLSVNGVSALILGPGLAEVEEVLAASRLHGAPVLVLDEVAEVVAQREVVLLGPDPIRRGRALANFARDELKQSRAALLVDEARPVCEALAGGFRRAWQESKGSLRRWSVRDLPRQAGELKEWKPDVLLLAVAPAGSDDLRKSLPDKVPVLYGGGDGDDLPALSGATVYTATAWSSQARLPEAGKTLLDALAKKQGQAGRSAVLGLDAMRLLLAAFEKAKSLERARLIEALGGIDTFDGVTGEITWQEGRPSRPLFIVRHQEGKEKLLRTVPAKP